MGRPVAEGAKIGLPVVEVNERMFGFLSHPVPRLSSHVFKHVFWRPSSSRPRLAAVSTACFHGTKAADHG